jgi:type IV pilus assembly protein PilA
MKTQNGFTLTGLTAVVSIGTMATFGISSYGERMARDQVAEVVERVGAARAEATEHFVSTGAWPGALAGAASQRTASVSIAAGAGSHGPAVTLVATLKRPHVNYAIAGKTVEFATADGGVTWVCRAGSLEPRYLPAACEGAEKAGAAAGGAG